MDYIIKLLYKYKMTTKNNKKRDVGVQMAKQGEALAKSIGLKEIPELKEITISAKKFEQSLK